MDDHAQGYEDLLQNLILIIMLKRPQLKKVQFCTYARTEFTDHWKR